MRSLSCFVVLLPVMAMILVRGYERFNSMTTSIPSLFGMKMSVMTTSGGFLWIMAMPTAPSGASSTLKPPRVSIVTTVERSRGSSSIAGGSERRRKSHRREAQPPGPYVVMEA